MEPLEASYMKSQIGVAAAGIFAAFMAIVMGYLAYLANHYVDEQLWLAQLADLRQEEEHLVAHEGQKSRYVERKEELVAARAAAAARSPARRLAAFFRSPAPAPTPGPPIELPMVAPVSPIGTLRPSRPSISSSSRRRNLRSTDVEAHPEE